MDKALVCVKHEDAIKLGLSFYSLFGYTSTLFTNLEWKNTILTKKSEDLRQAMSNAVNASARSAGPPQPPWGYGDRQGRTACGKFVRLLETLASTHVPITGERKIEWQVVQQEGVGAVLRGSEQRQMGELDGGAWVVRGLWRYRDP